MQQDAKEPGTGVATLGEMKQVSTLVRPIVTPAALIEAHKAVSDLIGQALEKGKDYGVIPGTGDKPTLLKPGAERLCIAFGAIPDYDEVEREADHDRKVVWTKRKKVWRNAHQGDRVFTWAEESGESFGLYRYVIKCRVIQRDTGIVLATGLGSCSTMESKYVDRPRDCENTVLKMAQKRAFVAATLNAFGLSDRFTQDVEDLQQGGNAPPPPGAPPAGKSSAKPAAQATGDKAQTFVVENENGVYCARGEGTFAVKDQLKELGFRWDKTAKAWATSDRQAAAKALQLPGCTVPRPAGVAAASADGTDEDFPEGLDADDDDLPF